MGVEHGKASKTVAAAVLTDCRGSVATIVAVALVPIIIAAGVGLDFARASSARANLQDAIDATALALAHLPANTPQATLDTKAQGWMNANLNAQLMGPVTLTVTPTQGQVYLNATSAVPTTLTAIAGFKSLPISAKSTVKWGLSHVEVALVLDNTGSMAQNSKLSKLKTAALSLVDTLDTTTPDSEPDALKISVVPFSIAVRIDPSLKSSAWLDGTAKTLNSGPSSNDIFIPAGADRFDLFTNLGTTWAGCVESRTPPYDVLDTAPTAAIPASLFVPYFAPDEPDDGGFPNNYLSDNVATTDGWIKQGNVAKYVPVAASGCNKNGKNCAVEAFTPTMTSGGSPNDGCTMTPLLRLTNSISTVKSTINAMQAVGETNIPMGLVWGWHTLSPNLPFADGVAYTDNNVRKIVVLLTDGENTNTNNGTMNASSYSGLGYIWQGRLGITSGTNTQRTAAMDAKLATLCANMKTAGVTLYTVRIDVSGSSPQVLKDCASKPDQFYDINSSNLNDAFTAIAGSIGQLRIAQ